MNLFLLLILFISTFTNSVNGFIEGIYCGTNNCYDVLGLTREATRVQVTKAYRSLARKYHPDVHKGEEAKIEASKNFTLIASAYEVLRDEESRKDYDYMLDNPDEVYRHYYFYFRRKYAPKVDVRLVIVITITVISAIQYWAAHSRYNEAIDYFLTVPKYRFKALEIAKEDGLFSSNPATEKKRNKGKTKEQIKQEEERILRTIIEDKMDIKGSYSKPTVMDILWIQILILPLTIYRYIYFHVRWLILFTILKHPLTNVEKLYLIRKYMKLSEQQFTSLDEHDVENYLKMNLWEKEKFLVWKKQQEDDAKAKMAESGSYKRYRRWMKKGGPGQLTFLDD